MPIIPPLQEIAAKALPMMSKEDTDILDCGWYENRYYLVLERIPRSWEDHFVKGSYPIWCPYDWHVIFAYRPDQETDPSDGVRCETDEPIAYVVLANAARFSRTHSQSYSEIAEIIQNFEDHRPDLSQPLESCLFRQDIIGEFFQLPSFWGEPSLSLTRQIEKDRRMRPSPPPGLPSSDGSEARYVGTHES